MPTRSARQTRSRSRFSRHRSSSSNRPQTGVAAQAIHRDFSPDYLDPSAEKDRWHLILFGATAITALLVVGTSGYVLIEGWTSLEAFYMTVITISTVGFKEVRELSPEGQLFTSVLIMAGVGVVTYTFSSTMRIIVEGEVGRIRGKQKMKKTIEQFDDHHIICGFGRLGRIVAEELLENGQPAVVIELDPDALEYLNRTQIPVVVGSAYEDETLKAAGIERAKTLLSLLPNDADNVYVTLCARDLNPNITIIARTEDDGGESRLRRAGANQVLAPYRVSGTRVVQRLLRPHVSDFLELAAMKHGHHLKIEEVVVPETCRFAGETLAEADLRNKTGAVIVAVIDPAGDMNFNPGADSIVDGGSTLIVLGEQSSLERLTELM